MSEVKEEIIRVRDLLNDLATRDMQYAINEFFEMTKEDKELCGEYIQEIKKINAQTSEEKDKKKKGQLTTKKGRILEKLAQKVINVNNIYNTFPNIRCDSNEIDLLAIPASNCWMYDALLPNFMKDKIIIECKNYNSNIPVTWVGKLYSLIRYKNVKAAILFSYLPLTGNSAWKDARGLVNKLFLRDQTVIINITVDDVEKIIEGTSNYSNIISLIKGKFDEIQLQTDIDQHISKHPAENES